MPNSDCLRINAHAKINLYLDVVGKRPDGYHEIETLFHSIQLHDQVSIRRNRAKGIIVHSGHPQIPCDERNLAYQAAELLRCQVGNIEGVEISIQKRIPVAAGLAGGSADAAAVLWGMNRLFELNLTQRVLMEFGCQLGADVPFCLLGGAALGRGIGEILTPLQPLEAVPLVLANPGFAVSTASVFQQFNFSLTKPAKNVKILTRCFQTGDVSNLADQLHNSLEDTVFSMYPAVTALKTELAQWDGCYGALMSGSGPTVFGIMHGSTASHRLAEHLGRELAFCMATTTSKVGLCVA